MEAGFGFGFRLVRGGVSAAAEMDAVAGLMEKMKLSEAEKKGIRVKAGGEGLAKTMGVQAIGKVLADRPVHTEALEQTLGKVWCPLRGIGCKDLGSNHFLFTFHQPSGKKRAIDDGPWLFGKDLIVVVDFDGRKRLEDIMFDNIPIWIRVSGLPLGMMNKETGEMIGMRWGFLWTWIWRRMDLQWDSIYGSRLD